MLQGRAGRALLVVGALLALAACSEQTELPPEEAARLLGVFQHGMESPDPYVRAETVRGMGLVRSPRLVELLGAASGDDSRMVRLGATLGLAAVKPDAARSTLVDLATDGDPAYRRVAVEELLAILAPGEERDELIAVSLKSSLGAVRLRAVRFGLGPQLAAADEASRRDVQAALSRAVDDTDPDVAGAALRLLVEAGMKDRLEPILGRARDRDVGAIQTLAVARLEPARATLEKLRGPGDAGLEAEIALAALGDEGAVDALRDALGPALPPLKRRILLGLGHGGTSSGLRVMRPLRDDAQEDVRLAVYQGLGVHKGAREDEFLRGLRDPSPAVGTAAALGLIRSNPNAVARALKIVLGEEEHRRQALELVLSALERLRLDNDQESLTAMTRELGELAPQLTQLAADKVPDVRAAAAELLFFGGDGEGRYATLESPEPEVSYAWASALAEHPPTAEPLRHLEALGRFDGSVQVLEVMAGAAIWIAYRQAAEPAAGQDN